jgi:hypothetical protein
MKILMLILASDGGKNDLYTKLQMIKRKYIHSSPFIESYFYICDPNLESEYKIIGDVVYVKTVENYPYLWEKFYLVLKAFENRLDEFDFICRPNLSTFFVIDRYLNYIKDLPKKQFCSGLQFYGGQSIPFPSGYMFTITPDIAKYILVNNHIIPNNYGIDDRCVGIILQKMNIPISQFPFLAIEYNDVYHGNYINDMVNNPNCFLIRIRHLLHENTRFGEDVMDRDEKDLSMHCALLQKFYNIDNSIYEELSVKKNVMYVIQ